MVGTRRDGAVEDLGRDLDLLDAGEAGQDLGVGAGKYMAIVYY